VQGRLLNLLVRIELAGEMARIGRIRRSILLGGLVAVAFAGLTGWLLGPWVVTLLYGAPFRPEPLVAALAATGVAGAAVSQLLGQLLVAAGSTGLLARRWAVGLGVATLVLITGAVIGTFSPAVTVATAFAAGELCAAAAMARRAPGPGSGPPGSSERAGRAE
jgi:O-antigen/teichoic acid export membrane protein